MMAAESEPLCTTTIRGPPPMEEESERTGRWLPERGRPPARIRLLLLSAPVPMLLLPARKRVGEGRAQEEEAGRGGVLLIDDDGGSGCVRICTYMRVCMCHREVGRGAWEGGARQPRRCVRCIARRRTTTIRPTHPLTH